MLTYTREDVFQIIEQIVQEVRDTYCGSHHKRYRYLSEDDFKCDFYARLHRRMYPESTDAFECNVAIHAEISCGIGSKLNKRPDLTLFYRDYMIHEHGRFEWKVSPDGYIAFIEMKFMDKSTVDSVRKDVRKLQCLLGLDQPGFTHKARGYVLCFSFRGAHQNDVQVLINENTEVIIHFLSGHLVDPWGPDKDAPGTDLDYVYLDAAQDVVDECVE